MSDTMGGAGITDIIRADPEGIAHHYIVTKRTTGTDIFPGALVTPITGIQTVAQGDVDLASEDDLQGLLVVLGPEHPNVDGSYDIDTAFGDNVLIKCLRYTGGRVIVAGFLEAISGGAIDAEEGELACIGTQDDGRWGVLKYADAARATEGAFATRATFHHFITAHTTEYRIALVRF